MRMRATVLAKQLPSKLGEYYTNGNKISVSNSCLKQALTNFAHHTCQYSLEALNNTPIATLEPSGLGDIQFVYHLGLEYHSWSCKGDLQRGKCGQIPKMGVKFIKIHHITLF